MKVESIIFDMDGTLWDSAENVAASWQEIIKKQPDIDREITTADIKSVMGMPMDAIGGRLFAGLSPDRQMEVVNDCGEYENEYLRKHGGILYDGLEEILKKLQGKYRLFIVSNCQSGYIEAFLYFYGFEKYFTDTLCWGQTRVSKGESIKLLMEKNAIKDAVYVGDIQGDLDSARYAGIGFIHAAYGFGQVDAPDAVIKDITELPTVLEEISI
ncbi:MAG: HAD family hydrolase [Coprococcus sp.]|nr:HAD family hydrolase [Coprococcus sp.]